MAKVTSVMLGVSSRNEAANIGSLVSKISHAFLPLDHFRLTVSLADASDDETVNKFLATDCAFRKAVLPVARGKGIAMKALAQQSHRESFDALFFCDADIATIDPNWILETVRELEGGADVVFPFRRPVWNAGDLTRNVAIPVIAALHGTLLNEPIGGEFAIGARAIELLANEALPRHADGFGIDVFLANRLLQLNACEVWFRSTKGNQLRSYHADVNAVTFGDKFIEVTASALQCLKEHSEMGRIRPFRRLSTLSHADLDVIPGDPEIENVARLVVDQVCNETLSSDVAERVSKVIADGRIRTQGIPFDAWLEQLADFYHRKFLPNKATEAQWRCLERLFILRTYNEYVMGRGSNGWYTNIEGYARHAFQHRNLFL